MSSEEWRPVVGWEGLYEVSSLGRIVRLKTGRIIKGNDTGSGHLSLRLWRDGRPTHAQIHRLVCEAFHGPAPEGKPLVLHWNDVPDDNRAENLRWGDLSDNQQDSVRNGTHVNAKKTHCMNGHPLSGENLRITSVGRRECILCGNELRRNWKRDRQPDELTPEDSRHGTVTGYAVYKCRCDLCVGAARSARFSGLASRAERGLPEGDPRHGTMTGYKQWGCKCPECRRSNAEYEADRKRRRAETLQVRN